MYLIEILLPLRDNEGRPFAAETYRRVRDELTELFGGLAAFTRAPAEGENKATGGNVHDDIVIYEIMTQSSIVNGGSAIVESWEKFINRTRSSFVRSPSPGSSGRPGLSTRSA